MPVFEPENEREILPINREKDQSYNAYNDLLKVANLSDIAETDAVPPRDIDRADAIRNLQMNGFDMGLVGARLTQGIDNGKNIVKVITEGSKKDEFEKFVEEMKKMRDLNLGEIKNKPETPILDSLGINTNIFFHVDELKELINNKDKLTSNNIDSGLFISKDIFLPVTKEEEEEYNKFHWYKELSSDLKRATDINARVEKREEAVARLREAGVNMPDVIKLDDDDISTSETKDFARVLINSAADILGGGHNLHWGTKEAALKFLKDELGIEKPEIISSTKQETKEIKEEEKKPWYEGLGKELYNATRLLEKNESRDEYEKIRGMAIDVLKEKIGNIGQLIRQFRDELFWASKYLVGEKGDNSWTSREEAIRFLDDLVKEKKIDKVLDEEPKVIEVVEKTNTNERVVWYDGIKEDLKLALFLDLELKDEEKKRRKHAAIRLRSRGINLPRLSVDNKDTGAYEARKKIRGAAEFVINPLLINNNALEGERKEAIVFLKSIGIGDGEGEEFILGSKEDKRRRLFELAEMGVGEERKKMISELEKSGVKIGKLIGEMEKIKPGCTEALLRRICAVMKVWNAGESEIEGYPLLSADLKIFSHRLGLE